MTHRWIREPFYYPSISNNYSFFLSRHIDFITYLSVSYIWVYSKILYLESQITYNLEQSEYISSQVVLYIKCNYTCDD